MSFEYRENDNEVSGTDRKAFTSCSDKNSSSLSGDEEEDVIVVFPEKDALQTANLKQHVLLLREKVKHLSEPVVMNMLESLQEHNMAAWFLDNLTPADVPMTRSFVLIDRTPIALQTYRMPPAHSELVRSKVENYLDAGIIRPAVSLWMFAVVSAEKKDGTARFCADYRKLNWRIKKDKFPLPRTEEIFDDLCRNFWFSTLYLFRGY